MAALMLLCVRAEAGTVKAEWKANYYRGPSYRWGCVQVLMGVEQILSLVEAREVKAHCSGNYGLRASWEALSPTKDSAKEKIAALLPSPGRGIFGGVAERWRELSDSSTINAVWRRGTLQYQISDGRACQAFVEAMDYMLAELPVRNVNQTVFCNTGSGFISLSLDYLAPEDS